MVNVPQAKPSVVMRGLDNEAVLYDEDSGATFHLNTTASMIWCLCDGTHSEQAIAEALVAVYRTAEPAQVQTEVRETLARFAADHLLV